MASDHIQTFIQNFYDQLCEGLDSAAIAAKLFSKKIIDFTRKQEILSKGSTQEANSAFADYLYRHANKKTVENFLQILEKDNQYPKHKDLGAVMRKDWTDFLCDFEVSEFMALRNKYRNMRISINFYFVHLWYISVRR